MREPSAKSRLGALAFLGALIFAISALAGADVATIRRNGVPAAVRGAASAPKRPSQQPSPRISFANLPMSFEQNLGQTDARVKFLSRGGGYALFLAPAEAVLSLRKPEKGLDPENRVLKRISQSKSIETQVLRVKLLGGNPRAQIQGVDQLAGKSNYFVGQDPRKWHANVPTYSKVRYRDIYPGVDLVYYGTDQRQLEYDFILAPGADPRVIALRLEGAEKLALNDNGDLSIRLAGGGEVLHHAPLIYQERDGKRERVVGKSVMRDKNTIGFELASYDHTRPVYIDPSLTYSFFLGGSLPVWGNGIALDSSGNAYVTGFTQSTNFPTTAGAFQTSAPNGTGIAFVTKLTATGSSVVYSTYLGGSTVDIAYGIAVDSAGFAYIAGNTYSSNFPTTAGAFQTTMPSHEPFSLNRLSGFVTKLSVDGSALVYSTFLGGSLEDDAIDIAVDSAGDAYVTGLARSADFPTTAGAFQTTNNAPPADTQFEIPRGANAFVTKLNADGSGLVYSTFLGGTGGLGFANNPYLGNFLYNCNCFGEVGAGITVDSAGSAYVSGWTSSFDFPTTAGAFQTTNNAFPNGGNNGFVTKLTPDGSALVYSTYLGGTPAGSQGFYATGDLAGRIAVDASGNAYVTGQASSTDFPTTPGAFQSTNHAAANGGDNAFVTKLTADGTGLVYSTYLGGSGGAGLIGDFAPGIAVNSFGDAYVTGFTTSTDFPISSDAMQTTNNGTGGDPNAFVTELNSNGSGLLYSTYLGFGSTSAGDWGFGVTTDSTGNAYVTGWTIFSSPPASAVAGAFNTASSATAGQDAFAAKLALLHKPPSIIVPAAMGLPPLAVGDTVTRNLTITNNGKEAPVIGNASSSNSSEFIVGASTCPSGGLAPRASCTIAIGFTPSALGPRSATLQVNDNAAGSPQHVALTGTGIADMTVAPASFGFGSVKTGSKAVKVIAVHNFQTNSVSLSEGFSGPNAADFSVTGGTCTSTLTKASVCTLIVTYAPTTIGTESATMTVTDSPDPLGPYTVSFSAAATIPESLSATKLIYGNVSQSAAKTLNVTVTNHATNGPITLTGTNIGGANSGDFAVTGGTCTGTLAASSSCTYAVTFTPGTETAESGTLSIGVAEDPNGGPPAVALSGTGVTPLTVVPASIAFGTVAGGHSSINRTVTVINRGGAAVALSESVTGANFADFAVTGGTCGGTLSGGGASCTYLLKFTPSIVGAESATLGVSAAGDASSPHNVSLTGTGS